MRQGRYLRWLIAASLPFVLSTSILAQDFSVFPAEIKIEGLIPGQETEFELTIRNKDGADYTYVVTTYTPGKSERRLGRDILPSSWVSFSQQVEIKADSEAMIKARVAIPRDPKWANRDWEIWLGITPESSDLLRTKLYVRLLVSTSAFPGGQIGHVVPIIGILSVLAIVGFYYSRRKRKGNRGKSLS